MEKKPLLTQEEISEATEHRDILLAVRALLLQESGKTLFKYLFKYFDVAQPPPQPGISEQILFEQLGIMRAGNSVFKLACEANAEIASSLLASIEKERYAALYKASQIGQG